MRQSGDGHSKAQVELPIKGVVAVMTPGAAETKSQVHITKGCFHTIAEHRMLIVRRTNERAIIKQRQRRIVQWYHEQFQACPGW